jgi:hypothetical protein
MTGPRKPPPPTFQPQSAGFLTAATDEDLEWMVETYLEKMRLSGELSVTSEEALADLRKQMYERLLKARSTPGADGAGPLKD